MRRTVRKIKRAGAVLLAACMALVFCVPAMAAEPEEAAAKTPTYTVRFFSGRCGMIQETKNGPLKEMVSRTYEYGYQLNANDFSAFDQTKVTDDKYYVKGIRESGKDYQEESGMANMAQPYKQVTHDIDYVVYYGVKGHTVAYTVNYVDADGNELLPSETYYGNVGDQVVVAYRYISEDMLPQAYNLMKTLEEDESENVLTFIYTQIAAEGEEPAAGGAAGGGAAAGAGAGAAGAGTGTAAGAAGTGAAGAGAAGAGAEAGAGAGEEGAAETEGDVDIPDEAAPQDEGPQDLLNLDDEDTPLANFGDGIQKILNPEGDGMLVKVVRPVAGVALAALLLGCLFFLYNKRKKKEEKGTDHNG